MQNITNTNRKTYRESKQKMKETGFKIATETSRTGTKLLYIKLNTPNVNYMKYRKANANTNLIN